MLKTTGNYVGFGINIEQEKLAKILAINFPNDKKYQYEYFFIALMKKYLEKNPIIMPHSTIPLSIVSYDYHHRYHFTKVTIGIFVYVPSSIQDFVTIEAIKNLLGNIDYKLFKKKFDHKPKFMIIKK